MAAGRIGGAQIITDATKAYQQDMDPLREFFSDRCIFGENVFVPVTGLRKAYTDYCEGLGVKYYLGVQQFNKRIEDRGCHRAQKRLHDGNCKCWYGIGLQD